LSEQRHVREDLAVIRSVFNKRHDPLDGFDLSFKQRQIAEREVLLQTVCELYLVGRQHVPANLIKPIRAEDVERAFAALRRLALTGRVSLPDLAAYCVRMAAEATHTYEGAVDPFQLRHILCYSPDRGEKLSDILDVEALKSGCRSKEAIRAWFNLLGQNKSQLPRSTPQLLRQFVLEIWADDAVDFATLAFELAVLDVRLNGQIGWENARGFFALLSRIAGSDRAALAAYLTDEDLDEALLVREALGDKAQAAFFRSLLAAFDTKAVRALEKAVFKEADLREGKVSPTLTSSTTPPLVSARGESAKVGFLDKLARSFLPAKPRRSGAYLPA
jgi:hypothetical protein